LCESARSNGPHGSTRQFARRPSIISWSISTMSTARPDTAERIRI
jgi:hypothetical protein